MACLVGDGRDVGAISSPTRHVHKGDAMTRERRASSEALALAAAFVGGACLSLQARFNGTLGEPPSEPLVAAIWSFSSGLALLVLALAVPSLRQGATRLVLSIRAGRLRWWECLGGVLGGAFVAVQTSTVGLLGVAVFIVASVGGRALGGLLADHVGAGPKGRTPITPVRAIAGAVAVVGVAITVSGQHVPGGIAVLPALAVIVAGVMTQFQQGLNGRVSARAGSSYATTLQNFLVGVIALVAVAGVRVLAGFTEWQWPHDAPWWAWLGAPLGIAFIGLSAWATEHISVLVLGLMGIMGQLVAALVIDLLDPVAREDIGVRTIVGMLVTALAAAAAARAARR